MEKVSEVKFRSGLLWIDLVDPSVETMNELAERFLLHPETIEDCLEPEHLPKYERIGDTRFVILRAYDEQASDWENDDLQELTRKIAIFFSDKFFITVHRIDQPFFVEWRRTSMDRAQTHDAVAEDLFFTLLSDTLETFNKNIESCLDQLEVLEEGLFRRSDVVKFDVEGAYLVRHRVSIFKRILRLYDDIVLKYSHANQVAQGPALQDLKETVSDLYFYADELQESLTNLFHLQVSLSSQKLGEASQKTNEVVRLLTVISLFFMPLNFIAGVYGMNFAHMPELNSPYGYPGVLSVMLLVTIGIYFFFRRKGWMGVPQSDRKR